MKKSLEEQISGAVRTLLIWCSILTVGFVGVLGLAIWGFAEASNDSSHLKASVKSPTHGRDIALWCNGINSIINYERSYTKGSLQESESEATTIEKAIANPKAQGLSNVEASFIRLYLGSVVALEREAPQTLSLHPFQLGDLNCSQIEAAEAASNPK